MNKFSDLGNKININMEKNVSEFWLWISSRMDEVGIKSFSELERRMGSGGGGVIKKKNDHEFPTVKMAEELCLALRVDWIELWTHTGYVDRLNKAKVDPGSSDLQGLDSEIYQAIRGTGDDFKMAVLKTIKTWLILYEELKK